MERRADVRRDRPNVVAQSGQRFGLIQFKIPHLMLFQAVKAPKQYEYAHAALLSPRLDNGPGQLYS